MDEQIISSRQCSPFGDLAVITIPIVFFPIHAIGHEGKAFLSHFDGQDVACSLQNIKRWIPSLTFKGWLLLFSNAASAPNGRWPTVSSDTAEWDVLAAAPESLPAGSYS